MTIIVNTHNSQEEKALLAFLDNMKYDYFKDNDSISLTEAQQSEIMERDKEYEAGETKSYSLDEIIAHFYVKEK